MPVGIVAVKPPDRGFGACCGSLNATIVAPVRGPLAYTSSAVAAAKGNVLSPAGRPRGSGRSSVASLLLPLALVVVALAVLGCGSGGPAVTPAPTAGRPDAPREVNVIARDYVFVPDPVDVIPGETVLIHFVNGGLLPHELVIGEAAVQEAWERAWAATVGGPPGATPVPPPAAEAGVRVFAASGQRVDLLWTVPDDPAVVARTLFGCHLPGHWQQGMRASLRIAGSDG